jgi:hypothetical protein
MSGGAFESAPPLTASRQALLVAPVRLALGLAGLATAVSIDLAFGTAIAEAALGAGLTIFALVAPGGRRLTGIALAFNRDLAAFLAGVLLGMGAVGLVYALAARS